ncbi:MAG: Asp-tRNA(Asn)/Glu-tRNA(Gln) amidotransferase subunit GatC [Candidatus Bathyarchaeota archaeon]|nr:Asp-tRNA(Asn)/Glu-tRNA(Gln) amidotransferase subunit GatC [Candidatus Bathyarchaeota archaeon]
MSDQWTIDKRLVRRIVKIARLDLSENEVEKFTEQLKEILGAFKRLDDVDTKGIEPSFHPQEISNVLRDDLVTPWCWNPLENTEHREGRHFKGPRIQ